MTILRCSAKLLKRLRQPTNLPEPPPGDNPLGEWYADIGFIDREPFVLLMNAATGLVLVLPGHAAFLKRLHEGAAAQLAPLLVAGGIQGPLAEAEVDAWQSPATYARTGNRGLVAAMNGRKAEAWGQFAYQRVPPLEVALRMLDKVFTRKDLGEGYHQARDLVRARLLPSTKILPFRVSSARH